MPQVPDTSSSPVTWGHCIRRGLTCTTIVAGLFCDNNVNVIHYIRPNAMIGYMKKQPMIIILLHRRRRRRRRHHHHHHHHHCRRRRRHHHHHNHHHHNHIVYNLSFCYAISIGVPPPSTLPPPPPPERESKPATFVELEGEARSSAGDPPSPPTLKRTGKPDTPKRPMNAFMVWSSTSRNMVHSSSKTLGEIWRCMTETEKKPYRTRAEELKRKFLEEHPNYKYCPLSRKKYVFSEAGYDCAPGSLVPGGVYCSQNGLEDRTYPHAYTAMNHQPLASSTPNNGPARYDYYAPWSIVPTPVTTDSSTHHGSVYGGDLKTTIDNTVSTTPW